MHYTLFHVVTLHYIYYIHLFAITFDYFSNIFLHAIRIDYMSYILIHEITFNYLHYIFVDAFTFNCMHDILLHVLTFITWSVVTNSFSLPFASWGALDSAGDMQSLNYNNTDMMLTFDSNCHCHLWWKSKVCWRHCKTAFSITSC